MFVLAVGQQIEPDLAVRFVVVIDAADHRSAWIKLARLTMPTGLPPLTTGTRLMRLRSKRAAISERGVSSETAMTPGAMISPTFLPCDLAKSAASVLAPVTAS